MKNAVCMIHVGADMIGDETYIDTILREGSSALKFDACLGTRAMMPQLTRIARVLGPRGLMPNPKTGTLIEPGGMRGAIEGMKKGRIQYRQVPIPALHLICYGALGRMLMLMQRPSTCATWKFKLKGCQKPSPAK